MDKLEGPAPVIKFLGIELDTIQGITRLPTHKLEELATKPSYNMGRKEVMSEMGPRIIGRQITTCLQSSQTRSDFSQKNV